MTQTDRFRLTLAQLNPIVGDLVGNADMAFAAWEQARDAGADMLALPEMFLTGYQTQDLVLKSAFVADVWDHVMGLAERTKNGPAIGIGAPYRDETGLYNAFIILQGGRVQTVIRKHLLPNSSVFDEHRLFDTADISGPYQIGPLRIGSPICEDAWHPEVCEAQVESGADILICPNGSPFARGKTDLRINAMVARVVENHCPIVYLNLVGGQDDQVFDGGSFVLNPGGELAASLPMFENAVQHVDFVQTDQGWQAVQGPRAHWPDPLEQDYHAMVLALRDYMGKSGFKTALLGLSGGIDSALVATIAADALGADQVHGVMLPSRYTSDESLQDADELAQNLKMHLETLPITGPQDAVEATLAPLFADTTPDLTEENIQSRLRGVLLMALSNKFGHMLLTTGNKSEVAVGYATIYGDMAGGYNPIKDLYKTRVFAMCKWRNEHHRDWMKGPIGAVIPNRIITKPPSAELRPDQTDQDSLPPYDVLDGILEMLIDGDASVQDCVAAGYDMATVKRVENLIYISEYKRFQSAPGTRLSERAFWLDRRYPIVNRWRDL